MTSSKKPDSNQPANNDDQRIEKEIREGRRYSLAEAIGREGGSFLKGESPVPKLVQIKSELKQFILSHLEDPSGALQDMLVKLVEADDVVCARYPDAPLSALEDLLKPLLSQEGQLIEFVRQVDMHWGQKFGERPHFERPGHPPHPDDEYTIASVRQQLQELVAGVQVQQD